MTQARAAIYLDSNASARVHPQALEAIASVLERGERLLPNPSSIHEAGRKGKRLLAEAREKIAFSLGPKTDAEQLVLTSSGSEANQLAIRSVLAPQLSRGEKPHWITTPIEHDSVLQMRSWLEGAGGHVSFLPVNSEGVPDFSALPALWRPETRLVSVVWVNNETGVVSPLEGLAGQVRALGGRLHIDAAQAWGKIEIDVEKLGADLVTVSGHKIGGLAGTGVLWVGRGVPVTPVILGKQEKGRRGGTENLLGAVALGAAAQAIHPSGYAETVGPLRDRLESAICAKLPGTIVNGAGSRRVSNTLNLSFEGIEGDGLVIALDLEGYSVSSGSACASGVLEPSHVLLAMGRSKGQAMAAVRVSLSEHETWEQLEGFVEALGRVVERMRRRVKS